MKTIPTLLFACLVATSASADEPRFLIHANLGANAYTYLGESGAKASEHVTPDKRFVLLQQIGAGYFLQPNVRLQLTLQFAESLSNKPAGTSTLSLYGAIPWAVFSKGRFFSGAGPLIALRYAGKDQLDVGLFTGHGVTFPLGQGLSLAAAVQVPITFQHRFSVAVSPALVLAKRF